MSTALRFTRAHVAIGDYAAAERAGRLEHGFVVKAAFDKRYLIDASFADPLLVDSGCTRYMCGALLKSVIMLHKRPFELRLTNVHLGLN